MPFSSLTSIPSDIKSYPGRTMYACVLIPKSLSLVLTLHPKDPRNVLEMSAEIWSNVHLPPGSLLYPDEGELRLDKLEVYSVLDDDDYRRQHGCYDVIQMIDGQEVRHCNWVRFVKASTDPDKVNVISSNVRGHPFFQVVKHIKPNDELVVLFHSERDRAETTSENHVTRTTSSSDHETGVVTSSDHVMESVTSSEHPDRTETLSGRDASANASYVCMADERMSSDTVVMSAKDGSDAVRQYERTEKDNGISQTDSERFSAFRRVKTENDVSEENIDVEENDDVDVEEETSEHCDLTKNVRSRMEEDYARSTDMKEEKHPESDAEEDHKSSSKGDHSSELSTSDLQRSSDGTLHQSTESDQSSPRENRVTSSEVNDPVPCPVTSTRLMVPDTPLKPLPLEGATVRRSRERTWWPCDMCPKKFDRPSLLKRHIRTHTGEKPHACDVCGKAFSTSSSLNTHRRIHSGEKPHVCPICGKRFTASSNLYYHRMTHNKEKPHKCDLCSKSFPTPGDLRSHMYVHSGSWPFRCHVCNRGFSKHTNLKNHLLLHSGDKPHQCSHCGKRFALQCNLKTHLKTHEADNQTSCTKCGVVFSDKVKKMADSTCQQCCEEQLHSGSKLQLQDKHHSSKNPLTNFSISKLTDTSPPAAPGKKNGNSPEEVQGLSPPTMTSPYGQFYGPRGWFISASGSPILSSTASPTSMMTQSPPVMCVMKDMASLPPYAMIGGKTSTPVSGFFSPDVLARGNFLPPAHASSPFQVAPSTPVGGWKPSVIAQGF